MSFGKQSSLKDACLLPACLRCCHHQPHKSFIRRLTPITTPCHSHQLNGAGLPTSMAAAMPKMPLAITQMLYMALTVLKGRSSVTASNSKFVATNW